MDSKTAEATTKKGRISINELHYLVMEGGGARGTTYLGAIRAVEKLLHKQCLEGGAEFSIAPTGKRKPGIMDYLVEENGVTRPFIKGIAGASAGAVTTFAIALGLNSEEIEEVLKFDFTRFISEEHTGKYRMISAASELMIGEDKDGVLGKKQKLFKYDLTKERTKIKGNFKKSFVRKTIVKLILKVIEDGVVSNVSQLVRFVLETFGGNWGEGLLSGFNSASGVVKRKMIRKLTNRGINILLYTILKRNSPVKVSPNIVASALLDRGMFSAFQVREFFYDLMLMAATRNTFFQRKLIDQYNEEVAHVPALAPFSLTPGHFEDTYNPENKLTLGSRDKYNFGKVASKLLTHYQDITCKKFQEITGLNFGIAVSNFTTSSPLYFSAYYTPDFRLLEAVAASMSLPPAMRPLYNESDVFQPKAAQKQIFLKVDNNVTKFVDANGNFSQADYRIYEYAVKRALQEYQNEKGAFIDITNVIELNTFMPLLRSFVFGVNTWKNRRVTIEGVTYEVKLDLLTFFYNAQFKGMLIDGGYYNNIPFNYFREFNPLEVDELPALKNVLAIKLEFGFPADFMQKVALKLKAFSKGAEEIKKKVKRELMMLETGEDSVVGGAKKPDPQMVSIESRVKKVFHEYYLQQEKDILEDYLGSDLSREKILQRGKKVDRKTILKTIEKWIDQYDDLNKVKPWAVPKSMLAIAMTGYEYGSKRGQIRTLSDHNFITVCHDFGVGTYDFDLTKVRPLEALGQNNAERVVTKFLTPQ